MKKSNIKVVKHGKEAFLSITPIESSNTSYPLLFSFDQDTKMLTFSCRGGCSMDLNKEQITELNKFISDIDVAANL